MGFFVFFSFCVYSHVCRSICACAFGAKGNLHFRSLPLFLSTLYFERQGLSVNLGCCLSSPVVPLKHWAYSYVPHVQLLCRC